MGQRGRLRIIIAYWNAAHKNKAKKNKEEAGNIGKYFELPGHLAWVSEDSSRSLFFTRLISFPSSSRIVL